MSYNTTTGLFESTNNTGTGVSALEVESLITPRGIDLCDIEKLGSKNIITGTERTTLSSLQSVLGHITITPGTPSTIFMDSNLFLANSSSGTKRDFTCDDIDADEISCGDLSADDVICNTLTINSPSVVLSNITNIGSGIIISDDERTLLSTHTNQIAALTQGQGTLETKTQNITATSSITSIDTNLRLITEDGVTKKDLLCSAIDCTTLTAAGVVLSSITNTGSGHIIENIERNAIQLVSTNTQNISATASLTTIDSDLTLLDGSTKKNITCGGVVCDTLTLSGTNVPTNLDAIQDMTLNTSSDTLFINDNIFVGAVGTKKNIECNNIDAGNISSTLVQTGSLQISGTTINAGSGTIVSDKERNDIGTAARDQLVQTNIPVLDDSNTSNLPDLTQLATSNTAFELKKQLYRVSIDNNTGSTVTYYIQTNIGTKIIVSLEFLYSPASASDPDTGVRLVYEPKNLKYYNAAFATNLASRIAITGVPNGFDAEGIVKIEYIN